MSDENKIRVLIADHHPLSRTGLSLILQREPDMEVVSEACTGIEAVADFREYLPDVVLMDLQMPVMDGAMATQAILSEFPVARIILLSAYDGDEHIYQGLRAGARALLLKDTTCRDLMETIRLVHSGQKHMTVEVGAKLAERMCRPELTEREGEVIRLLAQGLSNREIARTLFISEGTVKFHINHLLEKLDACDRTQAILIALKRGLATLKILLCLSLLPVPIFS